MNTETNPPSSGGTGNGTTPSATNGTTPSNSTQPQASTSPGTVSLVVAVAHGEAQPVQRSAQDAAEAAAINETRKLVGIITKDSGMTPLRNKGFDEPTLAQTLGLCDVADQKFDRRQVAIAAQLAKTEEVTTLFGEAVKVYVDFRESARTVFTDEGSLKALKVTDAVPAGLPNFLTDARSAYTTGKTEPYTTALAKKGYGPATLDGHLAALKVLSDADEAQASLIGEAQKATAERRDAVAPVQKFQSDLRRVARRVFRKEPEQLAKLDF